MSETASPVPVELRQQADYRFEVRFDGAQVPALITDEPPPLGGGAGPNPERVLAVAVANCLTSSLLFAMRKFKNDPGPLRTTARVRTHRNDDNRLRIAGIDVDLHLGVETASLAMLPRILDQFESFCVVTQSVREAFPVQVRVLALDGTLLKGG
ncbi:MAG: OsmC family protein [Rubrivivax sp.]